MWKEVFDFTGTEYPAEKFTMNNDIVTQYVNSGKGGVLRPILELNFVLAKYKKLLSTYGEELLDRLRDGKYLHTDYQVARTNTHRLSSKKHDYRQGTTNLQNLPANSEEGKQILSFIIAEEGHKLANIDMSGKQNWAF
jgi:hypothetical protein